MALQRRQREVFHLLALGAPKSKKLNFYNWDTYIGETTLADFKAASGIDVKMDLFAENDELFTRLQKWQSRATTSLCRPTTTSSA